MKAEEKISKAKIKLQSQNPFFSYLSLFLKPQESKDLEKWAGMGVDSAGNLYYKKEFVEKLTIEELKAVLSHEILHLALLHLLRLGNRNMLGFNIATDLVVNTTLQENGFQLPDGCLVPNQYDNFSFKVGNKNLINLNKKTAEQVYDELPKAFKQQPKMVSGGSGSGSGKGKGKGKGEGEGEGDSENYSVGKCKGFDKHIHGKINGKKLTEKQKREIKDDWTQKISDAYVNAKQKGQLPKGIERLIGKLHKERFDWKSLLRKYITNLIPSDYSWARRSKKSISTGYYMPDTTSEKINVAVAIDTSGSISNKDLQDFLSEIVGMARAFKSQMNMKLYTHDVDVHENFDVENGQIAEIMKIKCKGGGGTSHIPVTEQMDKDIKDKRAVIFFTDGYSDIDRIKWGDKQYASIFVLTDDGEDTQIDKSKSMVLKIR